MFRIADIDHLVLRVRDMERIIDFYCRVIGCTVEWRRPELGLVHLRAGRALIDLLEVGDEPTGARNLDHVCLQIADFDVDAAVRHLTACGVAVGEIANRFGANGRGMSIYLLDPEGNGVELKGVDGEPRAPGG